MSTPAQITANIINAQSSTGPRTEEGQATSSKNATKLGLFTARDFIRPGEQADYDKLDASLLLSLAPVGPLEETMVDEIRRAMWRLRRCGKVEGNMVVGLDEGTGLIFDPMESANPLAEKVQRSVDRARAQAHRLLHKCTAELRKLQNERKSSNKSREPVAEMPADSENTAGFAESASFCHADQTARNAPCPCDSTLKFKRCCGKNAPAVLQAA